VIPLLFLLSIVAFGLLHLAPGDAAEIRAGAEATPEEIARVRERLGLDKSPMVQYVNWVGSAISGDLGLSYTSRLPVTEVLGRRIGVTLHLAIPAVMVIGAVGVAVGLVAALNNRRFPDRVVRTGTALAIAIPSFVIGISLVLLFAWVWRGVLPYNGFVPISGGVVNSARHLLLPLVALTLADIGLIGRLTRNNVLEVLRADYVTAAEAFGIPRWKILIHYKLRNALLPAITALGIIAGHLVGGAVVIENVFGIPGVGQLLVQSFLQRDYPVGVAIVLLSGISFTFSILVADVALAFANPRVRRGLTSST
jgi:peptide/nickel transport system permease protein